MRRHFVTFYSPGTLVAEETTMPIAEWDITPAIVMAREIVERHGARPYGFCFTTRSRTEEELDSRETARSPMYYLGGQVFTREEIEARNDPGEAVLRCNMRASRIERVVVNENSYRVTLPLHPGDQVLEVAFP